MKRWGIPWRHGRARRVTAAKRQGAPPIAAPPRRGETRRALPRACLLLPLLALAGCGGAAAAHGPGDAQIARRAGLTLSDLPSGWRTRKPKRLVDCPAFRAARGTASASARSPVFMSHDDTKELSGTVEVYASRQAARGAFLRLTAPGSRSCVARTLRRTVPGMAGIRVRGVTDFEIGRAHV